jgi:hypothetical protein
MVPMGGADASGEALERATLERELEEVLLDPVSRKSGRAAALLADDFVEFGGSGRGFDKARILASLGNEQPAARRLSEFRLRLLTATVALVTCRAHRSSDGAFFLRSSVWRRDERGWRMVFHQGTPCAGEAGGK